MDLIRAACGFRDFGDWRSLVMWLLSPNEERAQHVGRETRCSGSRRVLSYSGVAKEMESTSSGHLAVERPEGNATSGSGWVCRL